MSFYIDISAEYLEKLNHFLAPKVRNDVDKPSELVKGDSGIFTMNHRGMLNLPTQPRLKIETHAFEALILTGGDHLHMSAIQAAGLWMEIYDVPLFDPGYGMMYDVAQQRLKQEEKYKEIEAQKAKEVRKLQKITTNKPLPGTKNLLRRLPVELRLRIYKLFLVLDPHDLQVFIKHRGFGGFLKSKSTSFALFLCKPFNEDRAAAEVVYGDNDNIYYPPARYAFPNKLPSQLFPSLDMSSMEKGITKAQADYVTEVIFCKRTASCTYTHAAIETADPLLSHFNHIEEKNTEHIKNVTLMVDFPACEVFGCSAATAMNSGPCGVLGERHDFLSSSHRLLIVAAIMTIVCPKLKGLKLILRGWDQVSKCIDARIIDRAGARECIRHRQKCLNHSINNVLSLMPGLKSLTLDTEFHDGPPHYSDCEDWGNGKELVEDILKEREPDKTEDRFKKMHHQGIFIPEQELSCCGFPESHDAPPSFYGLNVHPGKQRIFYQEKKTTYYNSDSEEEMD